MGGITPVSASASSPAYELNEATVDVGFRARVGGKTYDAEVTYSGGRYVASDSRYYGAEATGSSVVEAENGLETRIDLLV